MASSICIFRAVSLVVSITVGFFIKFPNYSVRGCCFQMMHMPPGASQPAQNLVPVGPSIVSAGAPIDPGPPHPTLYLNNLNDKIPIKKLTFTLSALFAPFGHIVRIVAKGRLALRGQAWIVFESTESSKAALSALQGMRLWDKTMHIKFAKFPTSVNPQDYRVRHEYRSQRAKEPRLTMRQRRLQLGAASPALLMAASTLSPTSVTGEALQLPNKTLFIQQVPPGVDGSELNDIFKRYAGFVEVRVVPNRHDLVFVEFENEVSSAFARNAMDQQLLRPNQPPIKVTFAKR
jgi:U2 small nuclear ribonucleoprotein B''